MLDFSFLIVPLSFSHVSESWEVERRTRYVAQHLICFPQNLIRHHSGAAAREERRKRRRRLALWCVWVDAVGESRWKSENYCHELHILEWWTTNTFFVLLSSTSRFCTQISYFFNFAFYVQKIKNSLAKNNKISCIERRSTPRLVHKNSVLREIQIQSPRFGVSGCCANTRTKQMSPITDSFLNQTHNCNDNFRTYFAIKKQIRNPKLPFFALTSQCRSEKPKVE